MPSPALNNFKVLRIQTVKKPDNPLSSKSFWIALEGSRFFVVLVFQINVKAFCTLFGGFLNEIPSDLF